MSTSPDVSQLVTRAAQLVRAVRNEGRYPAAALRVLSIIDERGPSRVTTLAELDQCTQPTMTSTVNALATAGLVTRSPDPSDARAQLVRLTEAGTVRLADQRDAIGEIVTGWLDPEDPQMLTRLRDATDLLEELVARSRQHEP